MNLALLLHVITIGHAEIRTYDFQGDVVVP